MVLAKWIKSPFAMQDTQEVQVQSLGQEDPLEEVNGNPLQEIPWTVEPGRLQSKGFQKVEHVSVIKHIHTICQKYYHSTCN